MESQTRFNLNIAIESWRTKLMTQAGLTSDVRRELETHLRDSITGFQQCGLNDEEAFWLARRRIGQPEQLVTEFAKADSPLVWRERVFWLVCGLLIFRVVSMLIDSFCEPLVIGRVVYNHTLGDLLPQWVAFYLPAWVDGIRYLLYLQFLPGYINLLLIPLALFLATRVRSGKLQSRLNMLMQNRRRFFVAFIVLTLLTTLASTYIWTMLVNRNVSGLATGRFTYWLLDTVPLVVIATWLLPVENKKRTKAA